MGFISRLTKFVVDDIKTPEGFFKGEKFEKYIRDHLFTKSKYILLHKTHDYKSNKGDYIENTKEPDLKFRSIKSKKEFFVEAKYRARYYEDAVEWCKPFQLKRYKAIDKQTPVYIALAVGKESSSPGQIFLMPVKDIKYTKLFRSFLRKYEVSIDRPIDDSRLQ